MSESSSDENEALYIEEDDSEFEEESFLDLFSDKTFQSAGEYVEFCKATYGIDLLIAKDMYEWIRLINFCRNAFRSGTDLNKILKEIHSQLENESQVILSCEQYLKPVIQDDALLYAFDKLEVNEIEDVGYDKDEQIKLLQEELQLCKMKVRNLLQVDGDEDVIPPTPPNVDDLYFDSYGYIGIHEEMLKDAHRTDSYRDALEAAVKSFPECTVLDVGCGTGILSLFAARAGAKSVVGVDASNMLDKATQIVKINKYDNVVKMIKSKLENIETDEIKPVDILVSEWMGYGLLFESMLDSVLVARDRWLKKDGILIPSRAGIYVQAQHSNKFDYWNDVYGFNFAILGKIRPSEALVGIVDPKTIISDRTLLYDIDLGTVTKEELDFTKECVIKLNSSTTLTSIVISWDCLMFNDLILTTSAETTETHWAQTVLHLDEFLPVTEGEEITVQISYKRNISNNRAIDIDLVINSKHKKSFQLGSM